MKLMDAMSKKAQANFTKLPVTNQQDNHVWAWKAWKMKNRNK